MRRLARHSSPRPALRATVAAVAAVLLVGGCAGGVAARGDGTVLTDDEVNTAASQFGEMTGNPAMLAGVATTLSRSDAISSVMADHGIVVTDAQIDARLADEGVAAPDEGLNDGSYDLWRQIFQFEDAQQLPPDQQQPLMDDLTAALGESDVELNPRYALSPQNYPLLPTWIATTPRQAGGAQGPDGLGGMPGAGDPAGQPTG